MGRLAKVELVKLRDNVLVQCAGSQEMDQLFVEGRIGRALVGFSREVDKEYALRVMLAWTPSSWDSYIFHDSSLLAPVERGQIGSGDHDPHISRVEEKHKLRVHAVDLSAHWWKA